jgi:hypothetical protein
MMAVIKIVDAEELLARLQMAYGTGRVLSDQQVREPGDDGNLYAVTLIIPDEVMADFAGPLRLLDALYNEHERQVRESFLLPPFPDLTPSTQPLTLDHLLDATGRSREARLAASLRHDWTPKSYLMYACTRCGLERSIWLVGGSYDDDPCTPDHSPMLGGDRRPSP